MEKRYVDKALLSGMDKVFEKPLSIEDLGKLMIKTGFIKELPASIRL